MLNCAASILFASTDALLTATPPQPSSLRLICMVGGDRIPYDHFAHNDFATTALSPVLPKMVLRMLQEISLSLSDRPLSKAAADFLTEGRARFQSVYCFDFVPSDYEHVWRVLDALPRGRCCEWGSGFGIVTGLAELLGFKACGIEFDEKLVAASRQLLADFELRSSILQGDYLLTRCEAETYFVYCWPSRIVEAEEYFERTAPPGGKLLVCHGQSDIRCLVRTVAVDGES